MANERAGSRGASASIQSKRPATNSPSSLSTPKSKRARPSYSNHLPNIVLVSSDGVYIPAQARLLACQSQYFEELIADSHLDPPNDDEDVEPPTVTLEESSHVINTLLPFVHLGPATLPPLEFPRDWALLAALKQYEIWRAIDAVHAAFSKGGKIVNHAAAFTFARQFSFPQLARDVALELSRSPQPVTEILEGLMDGVKEMELDGESVALLIGWLAKKNECLKIGRQHALESLKAFDEEYDCEAGCRGMIYKHLSNALQTTSQKRVKKIAEEVDFDCKDCSERWEEFLERILEGLKGLPECPFVVDDVEDGVGEDGAIEEKPEVEANELEGEVVEDA